MEKSAKLQAEPGEHGDWQLMIRLMTMGLDQPPTNPSSSMHPSDAELIQALKGGRLNALGELYDRYARLVYSLALRILANPNDAEDLTQEVFITLGNAYNPSRGSLSSFLATLTRSRAIDRLRTRNNRHKILAHWQKTIAPEVFASTPFEQASMAERREKVQQALADLPEKYRQVLELSYYEGRSHSEIAKCLGTPLGTVKTWARKGLLQLRQNLQDFIKELPND